MMLIAGITRAFRRGAFTVRCFSFENAYSALLAYKSVYGDVKIPQKYAIPENDDRFPKDTWGMNIGTALLSIRCRGSYSEHKARLLALGVSYAKQNNNQES